MRSHLPLTILAVGSLLFAGCLPESKNPLSLPSTSRIDSRLEGVYEQHSKDKKDDPGYWHIHYRRVLVKNSQPARTTPWLEVLTVESRKDGGLKTERYEALATRLGGHDYFSFITPDEGRRKERPMPYSFARYEVNWRGDLSVWIASDSAFAAAIESGKLRGKVTHAKWGETVEITDTTDRLAAFVAASDPKVLFSGEPMVMHRIAR